MILCLEDAKGPHQPATNTDVDVMIIVNLPDDLGINRVVLDETVNVDLIENLR